MRHHHQATFKGGQHVCEPVAGREVEIVGRFIEKEYICVRSQSRRQFQAGPLSARERGRSPCVIRWMETESAEYLLQVVFCSVPTGLFELLYEGLIHIEAVLTTGQAFFFLAEEVLELVEIPEALSCGLEYRLLCR